MRVASASFVDGSKHNWSVIQGPNFRLSQPALKLRLGLCFIGKRRAVHRSDTLSSAKRRQPS